MPRDFLHNHPQFADLIRIVADDQPSGRDHRFAEDQGFERRHRRQTVRRDVDTGDWQPLIGAGDIEAVTSERVLRPT